MDAQIQELMEFAEKHKINEQIKMSEEILAADPKLSPITAMVIAGDRLSADRSWEMLQQGIPYRKSALFVGSYARLDFALRALDAGFATEDEILSDLPDMWRSSDPEDSNPRFLELWIAAWERNGRKYLRDGKPLPRTKWITAYRGQDESDTYGIAWTLDKAIAEKFARGAATRQANRGGVVYVGRVHRERILGYLTLRGESEVIVDPRHVLPVS